MKIQHNVYITICLLLLTSGCATPLPEGTSPTEATWLHGFHTIPAHYTKSNSEKYWRFESNWMVQAGKEVKPGSKIPVVLYLHGCAGIKNEDLTYRNFMLEQGYAVFMPDSFARNRFECSQQGKLWERIDMRTVEVINALKQLKKLSWVDQDRIILMGFSEGGNTTDNWSRKVFRAHIVLGSACTQVVTGMPAAHDDVPVLAIVGEHDNYRPGLSCKITRTVGGSRSIVILGADHWVAHYSETQDAIKSFLVSCCK